MSADNSVIVGKFDNEYRVVHMGAADNLTYKCDDYDGSFNYDEVYYAFSKAPRFLDETEAWDYAIELEERFGYVEYGTYLLDFNYSWDEVMDKRQLMEDADDFDY